MLGEQPGIPRGLRHVRTLISDQAASQAWEHPEVCPCSPVLPPRTPERVYVEPCFCVCVYAYRENIGELCTLRKLAALYLGPSLWSPVSTQVYFILAIIRGRDLDSGSI